MKGTIIKENEKPGKEVETGHLIKELVSIENSGSERTYILGESLFPLRTTVEKAYFSPFDTAFLVIEGSGVFTVGGEIFEADTQDLVFVPSTLKFMIHNRSQTNRLYYLSLFPYQPGKGKPIPDNACRLAEPGRQVSQVEPVGTPGDTGSAGNDLFWITDLLHFYCVVHMVAMYLPRNTWKFDHVIRSNNDFIGILGIGQGKTQQTTCRGSLEAIGIPKWIGTTCPDHSNIDLYFPVLHSLVPSFVGT